MASFLRQLTARRNVCVNGMPSQSKLETSLGDQDHRLDEYQIMKCLMDWRPRSLAAAWSVTRDGFAAEDIFQNVALKSITRKVVFRAEAALVSWAYVATRREGIDWLRRNRRTMNVMEDQLMDIMEMEWMQTQATSVDHRLDALSHCLGKLPEKSRQLLKWRYHDGLSCQEVADRLKLELNAIYKRLSRLHHALRDCVSRRLQLNSAD